MFCRFACCFFFFSWSGAHRDLHSFPTRRSSDLRWIRLHLPEVGVHGRIEREVRRDSVLQVGTAGDFLRPIEGAAGGKDRKSTRLNSSHANISYAVFCLKKKKKNKLDSTKATMRR